MTVNRSCAIAELVPGVGAASLAAQPLAVDEVGAGQIGGALRPAQAFDGLPIVALGHGPLGHQRLGPGEHAEAERRASRSHPHPQEVERLGRVVRPTRARCRLDQVGQHPGVHGESLLREQA